MHVVYHLELEKDSAVVFCLCTQQDLKKEYFLHLQLKKKYAHVKGEKLTHKSYETSLGLFVVSADFSLSI